MRSLTMALESVTKYSTCPFQEATLSILARCGRVGMSPHTQRYFIGVFILNARKVCSLLLICQCIFSVCIRQYPFSSIMLN